MTLKTKYSKEDNIDIKLDKEYLYYLKNDFKKSDLIYEYTGINEISYFTKKGTKLGKLKIIYNGNVIKTIDVIYTQSLRFSILKFIWINKYIVILLLTVWFFIHKKKRKIKRKIYKMLNKM